jgi:hypothetical protein
MSKENNIVVSNSNKYKFKIILFLSVIFISIGVFAITYYTSINKASDSYRDSLVTNMNSINEVNKSIAIFNNNQTIDVNYAKEQLPNIIENLSDLSAHLTTSDSMSKHKKDYANLKSGLDNNLLIYRTALLVLHDASASDVEESMESIKTYRDNCLYFYATIDIKETKITLPQTSLTFIDNLLNYSYSAFMTKKETDIKQQQVQDFLNIIDGFSKEFLDIKTNYYFYAIQVRKNEMSYNQLLSVVEDNSKKLKNLKTDFNKSFSIPISAIPTYETFRPLFQLYETYLSDFNIALTSEKVQSLNNILDPSALDALYISSNIKFNEVTNYYDDFIKVHLELKHNN